MLALHGDADAFGMTSPLGMPETGPRAADAEARLALGSRRATIFMTPPRAVLEAPTYADARVRATALTGKSISAQSYALRHNVLEADGLRADPRVFEVHPELAFRAMAGRGAPHGQAILERGVRAAGTCSLQRGWRFPPPSMTRGLSPWMTSWMLPRQRGRRGVSRGGRRIASRTPPELDEHGRAVAIWY